MNQHLIPIPKPERIQMLVLDTVSSPHSRRVYASALQEFFAWFETTDDELFSKAVVQRYRSQLIASGLNPGSINHRLTAVRKLATEAADNGLLTPHAAAGIRRVKGLKQSGVRLGNWLSQPQVEQLLRLPRYRNAEG